MEKYLNWIFYNILIKDKSDEIFLTNLFERVHIFSINFKIKTTQSSDLIKKHNSWHFQIQHSIIHKARFRRVLCKLKSQLR